MLPVCYCLLLSNLVNAVSMMAELSGIEGSVKDRWAVGCMLGFSLHSFLSDPQTAVLVCPLGCVEVPSCQGC